MSSAACLHEALVWTDGDDWFIAKDRDQLVDVMSEYSGAENVADYIDRHEPLPGAHVLTMAWRREDTPEWACEENGFTLAPCEPYGDGWDVKVTARAEDWARHHGPGMLGSVHY